jgi:hypothetical protein
MRNEPATTGERQAEQPWERSISKYATVWLWSILFGAVTGVSYEFINLLRSSGNRSVLTAALALVASFGIPVIVRTWQRLGELLFRAVLPLVLPRTPLSSPPVRTESALGDNSNEIDSARAGVERLTPASSVDGYDQGQIFAEVFRGIVRSITVVLIVAILRLIGDSLYL